MVFGAGAASRNLQRARAFLAPLGKAAAASAGVETEAGPPVLRGRKKKLAENGHSTCLGFFLMFVLAALSAAAGAVEAFSAVASRGSGSRQGRQRR